MNHFTTEELKNISNLINRCNIAGSEALTVAVLQQKIAKMMVEVPVTPDQYRPEMKNASVGAAVGAKGIV